MESNPALIFFVSPSGNDGWSGRLAEANSDQTNGPFQTLQRARDAVRGAKEPGGALPGPIDIVLRGGTYRLSQTLVLTGPDGGTPECPVTWRAYPGETPVLSGGQAVTGWTPWRASIYQAELPEAAGTNGKPVRQLFYRGQRQIRARWPKFDVNNPIRGGWAFPEGPVPDFPQKAFRFKPDTFPRRWARPWQGEVKIFVGQGWANNFVPIQSIDYDQRIMWLAHDTMEMNFPPWFMKIALGEASRFCVENLLDELTEPGEWCCDTAANRLYFWPPGGALDDQEVVVPVLDCLVRVIDCQWINFVGLTLAHTTTGDNSHRNRLEGYGAMYPQLGWAYCGEAVHWRGVSHARLESCHFDQVGGNALYLERDCSRNLIQRNEFAYAGANGVVLIGDRPFHPLFNEVCDNHFHHLGALVNYVAGVFLGASDGNVVAHNSFHDLPHHAINLGTNGLGRNYIEYNEIRHVCLEIADTGAINAWMDVPGAWIDAYAERSGHVIRNNLIADVPGCAYEDGRLVDDQTTRGIYLDDCTSNCLVSGNVILRTGMGFMVHGGKHNLIENNIVIDCRMGLHGDDWPPRRPGNAHILGMFRANRFARNIVYSRLAEVYPMFFYGWSENQIERSDDNLFFLPNVSAYRVPWIRPTEDQAANTFERWRELGFDAHSVMADPGFARADFDQPEHEDFSLRPGSPAGALGFQSIDLTHIGIRPL